MDTEKKALVEIYRASPTQSQYAEHGHGILRVDNRGDSYRVPSPFLGEPTTDLHNTRQQYRDMV